MMRLALLCFLPLSLLAASQTPSPELAARTSEWQSRFPDSAPHWLTPEELGRLDEIGRDFTPTTPPPGELRAVAEYDPMESVLVRYPFGIPLNLIQLMSQHSRVTTIVSSTYQENSVRSTYSSQGVNLDNCDFLHAPTNSWWTRDYGPWFVCMNDSALAVVDFPYNRPRYNDDEIPVEVAAMYSLPVFGMDLVHTGGNYMCNGVSQAASSDLVLEENPGMSAAEADTLMARFLGIEEYYKLPDPNNTYIDHIDCWGKFLAPDKVLIRQVPVSHAQYDEIEETADWFATHNCSWGYPWRVYRVQTPSNQPYTNSLILGQHVYVPIMSSSWDDDALEVYEEALPGYEIHGVLAQGAGGGWESTDALHCRTRGIADREMLRIAHQPLFGERDAYPVIQADLHSLGGHALLADSLYVGWRMDGGAWQQTLLSQDGSASWSATLPASAGELEYFLRAADLSGRTVYHPIGCGPLDPHSCTLLAGGLLAPQVQLQLQGGSLLLSWEAIPGAADYSVESSLLPDQGYTAFQSTADTTLLIPLDSRREMAFFRVRARN